MGLNILKFHDVDPILFRRLQLVFGIVSIVAIVMELIIGARYGWSLGADFLESMIYAIMFCLFTLGWSGLIPAASGMAKQSFGVPLLLILLWFLCGGMGAATVFGSMQDSGEVRRIEAGSAGMDEADAQRKHDEAQATVERLTLAGAVSVQTAAIGVTAADNEVAGLQKAIDALDEKKFATQRGLKTMDLSSAIMRQTEAQRIMAMATELDGAKADRDEALQDIKKARKKAIDDKGGTVASDKKRVGDEDWYRISRSVGVLAMSFLCPLIFFATRQAAVAAESKEPPNPKPDPEPKPEGKPNPIQAAINKVKEEIAAAVNGAKDGKHPLPPRNDKPQAA